MVYFFIIKCVIIYLINKIKEGILVSIKVQDTNEIICNLNATKECILFISNKGAKPSSFKRLIKLILIAGYLENKKIRSISFFDVNELIANDVSLLEFKDVIDGKENSVNRNLRKLFNGGKIPYEYKDIAKIKEITLLLKQYINNPNLIKK